MEAGLKKLKDRENSLQNCEFDLSLEVFRKFRDLIKKHLFRLNKLD